MSNCQNSPSLRGPKIGEHGSFMCFHFAESGLELGHAPLFFPLTVAVTVAVDIVDSPHNVP